MTVLACAILSLTIQLKATCKTLGKSKSCLNLQFLCIKYCPWQFSVPFLGWLNDLLERLSDLQIGDKKVTLNHLVFLVRRRELPELNAFLVASGIQNELFFSLECDHLPPMRVPKDDASTEGCYSFLQMPWFGEATSPKIPKLRLMICFFLRTDSWLFYIFSILLWICKYLYISIHIYIHTMSSGKIHEELNAWTLPRLWKKGLLPSCGLPRLE